MDRGQWGYNYSDHDFKQEPPYRAVTNRHHPFTAGDRSLYCAQLAAGGALTGRSQRAPATIRPQPDLQGEGEIAVDQVSGKLYPFDGAFTLGRRYRRLYCRYAPVG